MKNLQELSIEEQINITGGAGFFETLGSAVHKIYCGITSSSPEMPGGSYDFYYRSGGLK